MELTIKIFRNFSINFKNFQLTIKGAKAIGERIKGPRTKGESMKGIGAPGERT